ncbi:carbohydrate ABC transporter permease [Glycomyces buryatensis]|uniref:Sugar ABC transporter permease n=1 Tax=Glycomyces buryatensis TaxID=2570927 RepID=A0A4S8Q672_9ACTN|nr:sugar ABC transporter permease [Glycomyces buryatensis]THV35774.1 sugar ABC transporter permease [Glycomyces buryatensis]
MTVKTETPDEASAATARQEALAPQKKPRSLAGLWFVLPFFAAYVLFLVWPTILGLYYSFTDKSLTGRPVSWIGLDNWAEAFGDQRAWDALWNTAVFTLYSTPPLVIIAIILALLVNRARKMGWFLRMAFFAPFVLPVSVVTMIWMWMYQPDGGLVNHYLQLLGIQSPEAATLWLQDENTAMMAVVMTTVWWTVGFNFLLYLAAIQSIQPEVYEAAAIDGANWWQQLWGITLPLLKKTTGLVIVLQLIASLRIFDQMYLMTAGGPNRATEVAIHYIYIAGFEGFRIGYASALSYVLFVLILIVSIVQFRIFSREED